MNIIGHRGAAGVALENTKQSLQAALDAGAAGIEIDVRLTKDNELVVCHDGDLIYMAQNQSKISELTLSELQKIELSNRSRLLSLSEALALIDKRAFVIIELKDPGCSTVLLDVLDRYPHVQARIASFRHEELAELKKRRPSLPLYALERTKPFEVIHFARSMKLSGIGLNYWILNPLTYWLARRASLDVYVYTVNKRFMVWFIGLFYPKVAICTDNPQWFRRMHPTT